MARTPKIVEDRREQIIDAAMRVFAQRGFSKATNRDVAREAGITPGLIYYYFESKEALLKTVLEERSPLQITTHITPEMLEQPPENFWPMLLQRVLALVEGEQLVGILRVMVPEVLHNPEVAPLMSNFIQRVLTFIGDYLRIQISKGNVRSDINLNVVAQMLMGTVLTFVIRRQFMHDPQAMSYTHAELAQLVTDTILQGVRPR